MKFAGIILIFFIVSTVSAQDMPPGFEQGEIKEYFDIPGDFTKIDPVNLDDGHFPYAYEHSKGALYFATWKQTAKDISDEEFDELFMNYTKAIFKKIGRFFGYWNDLEPYLAEDLKTCFNADTGFSIFAFYPQPEYVHYYYYVLYSFYGKKGAGIICQAILFSDKMQITDGFLSRAQETVLFLDE